MCAPYLPILKQSTILCTETVFGRSWLKGRKRNLMGLKNKIEATETEYLEKRKETERCLDSFATKGYPIPLKEVKAPIPSWFRIIFYNCRQYSNDYKKMFKTK